MTLHVSPGDLRLVLEQDVQHCHIRDGHWDADGRPCQECAARGRLYAALGDPCIECGEAFEPGDRITLRSRWKPTGPIHADTCVWDEPTASTDGAVIELPLSAATAHVPPPGLVAGPDGTPVDGVATPSTTPAADRATSAASPSGPGDVPRAPGPGGHLTGVPGDQGSLGTSQNRTEKGVG